MFSYLRLIVKMKLSLFAALIASVTAKDGSDKLRGAVEFGKFIRGSFVSDTAPPQKNDESVCERTASSLCPQTTVPCDNLICGSCCQGQQCMQPGGGGRKWHCYDVDENGVVDFSS